MRPPWPPSARRSATTPSPRPAPRARGSRRSRRSPRLWGTRKARPEAGDMPRRPRAPLGMAVALLLHPGLAPERVADATVRARLALQLDDAAAQRLADRLGAAVDLQLLEDDVGVELHRALGDVELARDLLVAVALGDQFEDLQLPLGQRLGALVAQQVADPVEQLRRHRRLQQRAAALHHADRLEDLVARHALQEVAARP